MTDYIERKDAIETAERAYHEWNLAMAAADGKREINLVYKRQELCKAVADVFKDAPAADVVPVVRCKDCEFSRELTKTEKRIWLDECRACETPEASQDGYMIVFPDHFCSYGKRRNGQCR